MAQTKTDYGLIYNDDGSMCTTVRQDQTPFAGVNSFAVETATTNLSPQTVSGFQGISLVYKGEENGWKKYGISGTWNKGTYPYCAAIAEVSFTGGEYYSTSAFFKTNCQEKFATYFSSIVYECVPMISDGTNIRRVLNDGSIYLARVGFAYVDSTTQSGYISLRPKQDGETFNPDIHFIYVKNIQIEKKPFASSFVNRTRPKGRLVIPVEDLKFDIANDDWVISYWKYPVATNGDTQNGYNICSLGQGTSDKTKGYIWWGKENSINKYRLNGVLNDDAFFGKISDNTFNPTDYFYHWHYEVLKKQGKVLSYYVDGVKQIEYTIPADKELQTPFDVGLSLGGYTSLNNIFYPTNALIAAPYYGYNSATWTDDYIREVYEAKIPFAVSNKLSIY